MLDVAKGIHIWCLGLVCLLELQSLTLQSSICAIYHLAWCLQLAFHSAWCLVQDIVFTLGVIRKAIIFVLLINKAADYLFSGKTRKCTVLFAMPTARLLKVREHFASEENEKELSGIQSNYVWIETLRNNSQCHFSLNSKNSCVCKKNNALA